MKKFILNFFEGFMSALSLMIAAYNIIDFKNDVSFSNFIISLFFIYISYDFTKDAFFSEKKNENELIEDSNEEKED